jgi:NAD(P)-dependent dehydrogenase (short-subunit alcohol dehydrogenase family)
VGRGLQGLTPPVFRGITLSFSSASREPGLALVLGTSGGLGAALLSALQDGGASDVVLGLSRRSTPPLDLADEASLAAAAQWVAAQAAAHGLPLRLLVVATGYLHGPTGAPGDGQDEDPPSQPERSWTQLDAAYLQHCFAVNAIGPALVVKHFFPLLARDGRCQAAWISARVGSIGDNALGGWYGYRASKAALNQIVRTASIELARRNRQSLCVALHPGTVDTPLSQPFARTGLKVRSPAVATGELLAVLQALTPAQSGGFFDYRGQVVPW